MHFLAFLFITFLIEISAAWTLPQFVLADSVHPTCQCGPLEERNGINSGTYVCGDKRLGPTELPKKLILGTVMSRYDRFGTLTPTQFIETWWNVTKRNNKGGWNYPEPEGFLLDERGNPVKANMTLAVGTLVDRFGDEDGKYFMLAGSPFSQRSLPPDSLNTDEKHQDFPNGYHVYNVTKPFAVEAGPIAPAFGQPGLGTQFWTGGTGLNKSVNELLKQGYLGFIASTQLDIVKTGCGQ